MSETALASMSVPEDRPRRKPRLGFVGVGWIGYKAWRLSLDLVSLRSSP